MSGTEPARGPSERFAVLYRTNFQAIYAYVLRRVHPDEAPDVLQEVFAAAWRSAPVATEATLPAEGTLPSRGTLPAPGGSGGARSPALRIELPVSGAAPSCASVGVHRR